MDVNILTDIGKFSKPVNTLIKSIATGTGIVYEPHKIVRKAKAEGKALLIKTKTENEVRKLTTQNPIERQDLEHRALTRFVSEETIKQINIENIIEKAIPLINDNAPTELVEQDWITNFFDKCRIVSDTQMQEMWARILASEANTPSSFSKRTVNLVANFDKRDAEFFTKLCTYNWKIKKSTVIINDLKNEIYVKNGINFDTLSYLASMQVVQIGVSFGYVENKLPLDFIGTYYGEKYRFELKKNSLSIGVVLFTQAGLELAKVCNSKPDDEFKEYAIQNWEKCGIKITKI